MMKHQYVERQTLRVKTEKLYGDRVLNLLFSGARECPTMLSRALSSGRVSSLLGFINFDLGLAGGKIRLREFMDSAGIDFEECVDEAGSLDTPRKIFERKIRYWEKRPMPRESGIVVSPADARALFGSFSQTSSIVIKDKFFDFDELLSPRKPRWIESFAEGDFAVFRLTPEKYHYNHCPVSGRVADIYEVEGSYYPCNPGVVVRVVTPHSKNKRVVTIIDTDVENGSRIGLVAMVEVVALMIGEIIQCYSGSFYNDPKRVEKGMFLKIGQPKSLYRPGSSTDVLIFQKNRIRFDDDLIGNMFLQNVQSRFARGFNIPLVETEVCVRSRIAVKNTQPERIVGGGTI